MKYPVLAAFAVLALAGCHHRQAPPAPAPKIRTGVVLSQARLVLPVMHGHPGAAYFTIDNQTGAPAVLVGIDIAGVQKTQMHETRGGAMLPLANVPIQPGGQLVFAPGGKHVMAFGIGTDLTPGGTSEMTAHFEDGKTTSAPLKIDSMTSIEAGGIAGMSMSGMAMSAMSGSSGH